VVVWEGTPMVKSVTGEEVCQKLRERSGVMRVLNEEREITIIM